MDTFGDIENQCYQTSKVMEEGYLSTMNYLEVFVNDEVIRFKQFNQIYGFDYHIFGNHNFLKRKICSL
jgi:hypothetical protein